MERKRKRGRRRDTSSLRAWSVNRARFVKWKGVAFSGKDRTGSPRDLTSLDPQFPTRESSLLLCSKLVFVAQSNVVARFIASTFCIQTAMDKRY